MKTRILTTLGALLAAAIGIHSADAQTPSPYINAQVEYGVVCDGVTNDQAHIQSALNAANASANRRVVQLPAGNCLLTSGIDITNTLTSVGNVTLQGQGVDATTLLVDFAAGDVVSIGFPGETVIPVNVRIKDFSIGPKSGITRTSGAGVHKYATNRFFMEHVNSTNMFDGMILDGWNGLTGNNDYNTYINNSYFESNSDAGIVVGQPGNIPSLRWPQNVWLADLDVSGNGVGLKALSVGGLNTLRVQGIFNGTGLQIAPQSGQAAGIFSVNDQWDTSSGPGVSIAPASGGIVGEAEFTGLWASSSTGSNGIGLVANGVGSIRGVFCTNCHFINNAQMGVWLNTGNFFGFTGSEAAGNSAASSSAHSGMEISGSVTHVNISGGNYGPSFIFSSGAVPVTQKYGIDIATGADTIMITGVDTASNNVAGGGCTAAFGLAGSGIHCATMPTNSSIGGNR